MNSLSEEIMTAAAIERAFLNETREQTDLERLIADSIAKRAARIAEEEAARATEEARYDALFQSLLIEAIEAVKPQIPAPLQPYIRWAYSRPGKDALDARTWRPASLHIRNAPGLEELTVCINWDSDRPEVHHIETEDDPGFGPDDWGDAIAAAADRYKARRAEYSRAARGLGY